METGELVDPALIGFDRRETATIPPLPDANQWSALETARRAMLPNFMQTHPAERYRTTALTVTLKIPSLAKWRTKMHRRALLGTFATASVARLIVPHAAAAQAAPKARNVVLLHGLFADGSCWSDVIRRLQAAGINATSVQNPLTTLEESVAAAQRVLALQDGPTVLVGHSFSGMIVTEAGGDPNPDISVRPNGAVHQWRKDPPRKLSVGPGS